ncbi:MAG: ABC-three component system middle component 6 [Bdellovibrionales bacterium]
MLLYDARFLKTHLVANMLIPDNIHPEQTIYFNGAIVLKAIQEHRVMDILELYMLTSNQREMSMPVFLLCLDWLFLLDLIKLNDSDKVEICF